MNELGQRVNETPRQTLSIPDPDCRTGISFVDGRHFFEMPSDPRHHFGFIGIQAVLRPALTSLAPGLGTSWPTLVLVPPCRHELSIRR